MNKQKNPVNKTVRVKIMRNGKLDFVMPAPDPTVIGYVVRYEHGGVDGALSEPLNVDTSFNTGGILLINYESGTIFPTFEQAKKAVVNSIEYQFSQKLNWNKMYGDYLISPVAAR